ncbi:SH3 domain-containing protein [Brevundimonas sp. P7753]|uniref:SH3 domain-containing protein n=1 Tax=Brevundimonas sp. P7753 TaxID=2726982 RepID=UPI0015BE3F49|nr:SH3 domain-containing protein [Brevundimonas sp. P7753]NWE53769.1 SH3 domain-containing protein [Brevundimonas sp. P7753]
MPHFARGLTAVAALTVMLTTPAEAQIFGRRSNNADASVINETPRCTQNLGTVTIADTQSALFSQLGVGAPSELLRYLIRESGCFTLIERGPGMDVVERERGLGAAGRIRTADFVLVAELANPIEADSGDSGRGLLGSLASSGGRLLLQAGVAAVTQGQGADMGAGMAQMLSAGANVAGNQLDQALSNRTVDAIKDLKKDLAKGKEDAQVVFSLSSVPLAETVGYTRAVANKDDWRRLRIRDNHFGGRVGAGYETEDEGKTLALAFVRGYADLVTSLGGTGSTVPEVTLANREALRVEAAAQEAKAARPARGGQEQRSSARPAVTRYTLARASVLRSAPDGDVVRTMAAEDTVFPTGAQDGDWVEVLDADDNVGWLQRDRLATED